MILFKKNGGVFFIECVYVVIDGCYMVKGYGICDMLIWGKDYLIEIVKVDEYFVGMFYNMEMYVCVCILFLVDYLY